MPIVDQQARRSIALPGEYNSVVYDADWRYHIALKLSEGGRIPSSLLSDPYVTDQVAVFQQYAPMGLGADGQIYGTDSLMSEPQQALYYANRIRLENDHQDVREMLEPLLLTRQPFRVIAQDLNLPLATVKAYERVFFAVRDDLGTITPSPAMLDRWATKDLDDKIVTTESGRAAIARVVGARLGYHALVRMWRWRSWAGTTEGDRQLLGDYHGMALGSLAPAIATGELNRLGDINGLLSHFVSYSIMEKEAGGGAGVDRQAGMLFGMLKLLNPRMRTPRVIEENPDAAATLTALEQEIQNTEIVDHGVEAGHKQMDKNLQARLDSYQKDKS